MQQLRNLGDVLRLPARANDSAFIDLREPRRPGSVSAHELDALARAVARGLRDRGIAPGQRVGILSANRLEFIASLLGIMRLGAIAVPVNFKLPPATIAYIFRDSEIQLVLVDAARRALAPAGTPLIDFDAAEAEAFDRLLSPGAFATFDPSAQDVAEILYTSGSTGLPKGVPLTHAGQLWAIGHYLKPSIEAAAADTTIVVAPLYHMNAVFFSTIALANRMTIVSLPSFEARRYLETVAEYRCTVLSGIPTMFALMVREHDLIRRLDLSSVREIIIGSAPLSEALLQQVQALFPNASVRNGYGTTEAGPAVFGPHREGLPIPPLSVGYPLAEIRWKLIDGATPDEGVLALRTPALTAGYLNLPAETSRRMHDGWYVTGDVMRRDADGFFFFVGRDDDMIVCGGENVYPGEIEKLLERHPGVGQAVVVAAPDSIKGQIPVAFVVPAPGARPTEDEIKRYALEQGPAYAHPRFVRLRAQMPLSGTHKIDRNALSIEAREIAIAAGRASSS